MLRYEMVMLCLFSQFSYSSLPTICLQTMTLVSKEYRPQEDEGVRCRLAKRSGDGQRETEAG
jgi:hypothetical protein